MNCPKNVQRPFLPPIQCSCSFEFKCKTVHSPPASLLHLSKSGTQLRRQIIFSFLVSKMGFGREGIWTQKAPKGVVGDARRAGIGPGFWTKSHHSPGPWCEWDSSSSARVGRGGRAPLTITRGLAPPPGHPCWYGHPPYRPGGPGSRLAAGWSSWP